MGKSSGFLGCSGHLKEMHRPKKPFVAFLSHSGSVLGYNDWTIMSEEGKKIKPPKALHWPYNF